MPKIMQIKLLITLIGCLLIFGCTSPTEKNAAKYSDALIIVTNAKEIRYDRNGGSDQVLYVVKEDYPAASVLHDISQKLAAKGWKPLLEDYLNPGDPSSHVRGWTYGIDAQKAQRKIVYQWLAQWENNNHDILWCTLRYTFPEKGREDLKTLRVIIAFIPAKIAAETRKQADEFLKKNEKELLK